MSSPIVETSLQELQTVKALAENRVAQLDDQQLWTRLDPASNSVAVLMRHMAGNMRSRWTHFRTSDGEKPDRNRDQEFEDTSLSRAELLAEWDDGWQRVFAALRGVTDAELQETVYIRQAPHTIYHAMLRQIVHYAGHAYQILFIAKHLKGAAWTTLSIPRGQSEEFNRGALAAARRPTQ